MTKRELDILEKCFAAEIEHAVNKTGIGLYQTKSKLAEKLAEYRYIQKVVIEDGLLRIEGYELTETGRFVYCMSDRCKDAVDEGEEL